MTGSGSSQGAGEKTDANRKNLSPALDLGSHINATHQAQGMAGARHERTLATVACKRFIGIQSCFQ
jgi:hypothetical protein